jgi:hypothetical protein
MDKSNFYHLCTSVNLSVSLFVFCQVCVSLGASVRVSVRLSVRHSVCLSITFSVCPSICLSLCLSVNLSVTLSVHLFSIKYTLPQCYLLCVLHCITRIHFDSILIALFVTNINYTYPTKKRERPISYHILIFTQIMISTFCFHFFFFLRNIGIIEWLENTSGAPYRRIDPRSVNICDIKLIILIIILMIIFMIFLLLFH